MTAGGFGRALRRHAVDTRPLAVLPYRRLLIGQGTSFVGSMLTQVAVPVQVFAITNSSFYVGLVSLGGLLPLVTLGIYGGAIADRVDRRRLSLVSSLVSWLMTLGLLLLTLAGVHSVWAILGLVAVQSGAFAVSSSSRGAIIPRIVPLDLVAAANTLSFTISTASGAVGPLLAGAVVGLHHGFVYAYTIDAVLFTAGLYANFRLPPIPPDPAGRSVSGMRAVGEGLRFIGSRPVLVMSFLVDIAAMVLAMPRSLFPEVAADRFHGSVGLLYAAIPIGSVVAGLSSGWISRVRRQGVALVISIACWGACVAVAGLVRSLWLVLLLLAVAGAADLVSAVYRQTILQTYAPDEMRGRMQGVFTAVVAGGPRLGDLRAGAMASLTTLTISWTAGGIACLALVVVAGVLVRPFWRYDAQAALEKEAVASAA